MDCFVAVSESAKHFADMLSEKRRRVVGVHRRFRKPDRIGENVRASRDRICNLANHFAMNDLRFGDGFLDVVDAAVRDAGIVENRQPFVSRLCQECFLK